MNIISYNSQLKQKAKYLRNNSSKAEKILWMGLRKKQLLGFSFNRQKMIDNYIVDFFCKELRLAVEVDDKSHDLKYDYDTLRTEKLNKLGVKVLRFTNEDVYKNADGVLEEIKEYILSKRPSP